MQFLRAALTAIALGVALPAAAQDAAGPSVGHPLSPLCDLICGGTWQPDHPAYPDEIRTSMTYGWDSASQTIKGRIDRSGGIAGIRQIFDITYAYDPSNDSITSTSVFDDAASTRIEGQTNLTVTGKVMLSDTGFQTRFETTQTPGEVMITAVQFETPDIWVQRSEIVGNGQSTLGAELRYARNAE